MIETLLTAIGGEYPLTEQSVGEFAHLKASGMKFTVRRFQAAGLGAVSVMTASGFFGLMKMDTLIINPTEKDMPLLSYDRVYAMGNDTLIFELYDTFLHHTDLPETKRERAAGRDLPRHDVGSHWYDGIKLPVSFAKKGKKLLTPAFDGMAESYLDGYLRDSRSVASCQAQPKREKAAVYVEGLLKNGGPSTDVFKKALGEEKTAQLFRKILFATEE